LAGNTPKDSLSVKQLELDIDLRKPLQNNIVVVPFPNKSTDLN